MGHFSSKILKEISIPEYRKRHIFTAKLRLAIFIGFWFLYVVFLKDHLGETKSVTVTIAISFLLTTIGYYNIFNNRYLITSFLLEIFADIIALTAIIYLTGGPESHYYLVYVVYATIVGLFYSYRLALFVSIFSALFYAAFIILCYLNIIPPIILSEGSISVIKDNFPYLYLVLLVVFLLLTVYAIKIAHYFTQIRERMLVERNKELLALQQMSATIRTVASLNNVILQVINGVLEGLDFKFCLLMMNNKDQKRIECIVPEMHPVVMQIEKKLGRKINELYFPYEVINTNSALMQVNQGRIIFRKELRDFYNGIQPTLDENILNEIQQDVGIKRILVIPLVTGRDVIGALVGFTSESFVEPKKVSTFQSFADQAALAIEAAQLISELRNKNVALVEANRVKSEFLATMSHELRTPLTAIIGFSELLLEGVMGDLSSEQQDSLTEVLNNGNNLLEMINNLLDLAKVEAGKMELNRHSFDWTQLLSRIERSVSPLIKRKGHTLDVETAKDLPIIFADEKRIQQVMLNLLSNAIKFTPENGKIEISTKFYEKFEDILRQYGLQIEYDPIKDYKGFLVCSVFDTGIGIAKENLTSIFDVFQQVDSSVTRTYEGTGLGLALVRQFIELHNGYVWVNSEEGKNTRFTFFLPIV